MVILLTLSFFVSTTMSQNLDYYSAVAVIASSLGFLIEPFLMWYTLKPEDAISEAQSKLAYDLAMIHWQASKRPRHGRKWVAGSLFTALIVGLYLLILVGLGEITNSLLSIVGLARLESNGPGLLLEGLAKNRVRQANGLAKSLQDIIQEIIKILWG